MGLETKANVVRRTGKEVAHAKNVSVLWEGDAFVVRGDARIKIAREDIKKVDVRADDLIVSHSGGSVAVALGNELAKKWREKIESKPKTRLEKLGIGANTRVVLTGWVEGVDASALSKELADIGAVVRTGPVEANDEVVLLLVEQASHLARIATTAKQLPDSAALWVVHPKGVPDVADTRIFEAAKRAELTYTKVASFSSSLTAEKLVRPVASRASASARSTIKSASKRAKPA